MEPEKRVTINLKAAENMTQLYYKTTTRQEISQYTISCHL